ncbi:response regulator transcription factor [Rhizobium leguminosarum]|uniref:response regulator n=1 Tax=Rhizobium leguminosarum TaxID=384 RepID=UPI001C97A553|nr:response regulator transcription factor [Rhizobium leguminosarum]MBY5533686.1 response regulator transcription factor [Rhizobium leguminosarum]
MPESQIIRILCVDDHPLVREGINALVSAEADMVVVAEADNGLDAVERAKTLVPDVTLLDIQMPGMTGIETIVEIRKSLPGAKVVVLTTYAGDGYVKNAMLAGAQAYLLKSAVRKLLINVIRQVNRGQKYVDPEAATQLAAHYGQDALTDREVTVLKLIAVGSSNKVVAAQLAISEETVKGHVKNILFKLQANDRTHAVTIGLKRGIIAL